MKFINLIIFLFFLINVYICNNNNNNFVNSQTSCPHPLVYRNTSNYEVDSKNGYHFVNGDKISCVLPCPSLLFTENQWDRVLLMSLIANTISMVASLFLVITYSPLVNRKHTRHSVMILFLFISIFLMMVTDGRQVWDLGKGYEKYCPEPGRYATQSDGHCLLTGVIFQFGCISSILFWCTLSIDLWMTIKKIKMSSRQLIYYFTGVYSIAILLTFIPIAINQYGYSTASIGCWLIDLGAQIGFFFGPVGFCLVLGCTFIGMIIFEIYQVSDTRQKRLLAKHFKPLCLIVLMLVEFFYMFIFYSYITSNRSNYNKTIGEYVTCILQKYSTQSDDMICTNKETISHSAHFFFHLCTRLMGMEGLIFFGFTNSKRIWRNSYWLNNSLIKRLFPSLSQINSSTMDDTSKSNNTNSNNNNNNYNNTKSSSGGSTDNSNDFEVELSSIESK